MTRSPPNSNKHQTPCSFDRETDAPFEVINWQKQEQLTQALLLQLTEHPPDPAVQVVTVDEFFDAATQEEAWHDEEERETAKRFQNLVNFLKQNKKAVAGLPTGQYRHGCVHCRGDGRWRIGGAVYETGGDKIATGFREL
ncbi:nuclease A inhibitor family protein [Microcoleus sp. AR_TQ3_B6]